MLTDSYNALEQEQLQIMDNDGKIVNKKEQPQLTDDQVVQAYKTMLFSRTQEEKMTQFQRQGRMLTFLAAMGQEATQVGSAMALDKKDWLVPAFRSNAAWIYRGYPLEKLFTYWSGDERGSQLPEDVHIAPINIPIATQFSHATGIAMAAKYRGEDTVVLTYIGDGGTSEGEFYEALNFAANYQAPVIFLIQNNQFAISTPRKSQTMTPTLAQKGIAAGIPNIQVDGNDLLAVYAATKEAVERARAGQGPTLIEAVTYRLAAHSTADDPTIYRDEEDYQVALTKEPLIRMKKYLIEQGLWSEEQETAYIEEVNQTVKEEFQKVEAMPADTIDQIFVHTYATMTPELTRQLEIAKQANALEEAK